MGMKLQYQPSHPSHFKEQNVKHVKQSSFIIHIYIYIYIVNKSILVLDVISQVVSALLVVSGPSEHGRQRLLSFTHAGGLEPEWRPMHELFVCSHYVPFDTPHARGILRTTDTREGTLN